MEYAEVEKLIREVISLEMAKERYVIREIVSSELANERQLLISRTNQMGAELLKIEQDRLEFKETMNKYVGEMFKAGSFVSGLKKHLYDYITQEVNATIKNGDYHAMVGQSIKDKIAQDIKPVVRAMVEEIMNGLQKGLCHDYEVVKNTVYSMDKEIQHFVARTGLNLETEELIRQKIGSMLETIEAKAVLQLEHKQDEISGGK